MKTIDVRDNNLNNLNKGYRIFFGNDGEHIDIFTNDDYISLKENSDDYCKFISFRDIDNLIEALEIIKNLNDL